MQLLALLRNTFTTIVSFLKGKTFTQFMFFLALSTAFWFFEFSKETRTLEFKVPLDLNNVPENVVVTTELPKHVTINVKASNSSLVYHRYFHTMSAVSVNFETYANPSFRAIVPKDDVLRTIKKNFSNETEILSLSPDTLEYYYSFGSKKEVPIRFEGKISTPDGYYVSETKITPSTVTVYANDLILDSLTSAQTVPLYINDAGKSQSVTLHLQNQKGMKFVPDTAKLSFTVDRLIEKTLSLPIEAINTSDSVKIRTFPGRVNVTFLVGTQNYRNLSEEDFKVVVDASKLKMLNGNKCKVELQKQPEEAVHIRFNQQEVEFLIEDIL